jgi:Holliday junction resolvase RusA-like endonuclease
MRITFIVEGTPTGKARPRFARIGRHVRAYQPAADAKRESLVAAAYRRAAGNLPPYAGPVAVTVEAVFTPPKSWPRKRRENPGSMLGKPDGDNILKSILDGLNGVAFGDDSHIVRAEVAKWYGDRDETRVTVEFLNADEGHFPARGDTLTAAAREDAGGAA